MKTAFLSMLIVLCATMAYTQGATGMLDTPGNDSSNDTLKHSSKHSNKLNVGIKNADQVLPRRIIDISYERGIAKNDISLMKIQSHYPSGFNDTISKPVYTNLNYNGVNLQLGYFFGTNRRFGIGTGIQWTRAEGDITLKEYKIQYKSVDKTAEQDVFRQILTSLPVGSGNTVQEKIISNNFMIPLMLKLKHQFKNKNFGYTLDAGLLFGIKNFNSYSGKARFQYEAVYKYDMFNDGVYDQGVMDSTSRALIQDYWIQFPTSDGGGGDHANAYFSRLRDEGYNVALDASIKGNGSKSYTTKTSIGFMIQPGLTYSLGYHTTLLLGGFYSYQTYKNNEDKSYKLTDVVGEYLPISEGILKNVVTAYGIHIGCRFFFGEKRDIDDDGVPDKDDKCPELPGHKKNGGCPDKE